MTLRAYRPGCPDWLIPIGLGPTWRALGWQVGPAPEGQPAVHVPTPLTAPPVESELVEAPTSRERVPEPKPKSTPRRGPRKQP